MRSITPMIPTGPMGLAGVGAAAVLGIFVAFGAMLAADHHLRPARSG